MTLCWNQPFCYVKKVASIVLVSGIVPNIILSVIIIYHCAEYHLSFYWTSYHAKYIVLNVSLASIIMLNVILLSAIVLNVILLLLCILLSVIVLDVILASGIMLNCKRSLCWRLFWQVSFWLMPFSSVTLCWMSIW